MTTQPLREPWIRLLLLLAVGVGCTSTESPPLPPAPPPSGTIQPLTSRFDSTAQPFAFVLDVPTVPAGLAGMTAQDCGVCHQGIHAQWAASTHASALSDLQFQSEITKPDSPKWLCLNCHIPLAQQRDSLVVGLVDGDVLKPVKAPNPGFNPALQQEGITCATCHVRTDPEDGTAYIIGPNGLEAVPHPVRKDAGALRSMCQRCHNPQGEAITPNLICWFETFAENEAAQPLLEAEYGRPMDCAGCHMPEEEGYLAELLTNLEPRPYNRHVWPGGGVPKTYDGYDTLLDRGYQPGLEVSIGPWPRVRSGRPFRMPLTLTNARAGHHLPTGDPERFLLALVRVTDASGQVVATDSLRIGQTWAWNPARKLDDNRLAFGEAREWRPRLQAPPNLEGATATVTVLHVRLASETATYIRAAAPDIDTLLAPAGRERVANLTEHYPQATFVYEATVDLVSGEAEVVPLESLVARSRSERGKPLSDRIY